MAKKLSPARLQEELKKELDRFKLISEYTFYTEKNDVGSDDLILGSGAVQSEDSPEGPEDQSDTNADPAAVTGTEPESDDNLFGTDAPDDAAAPEAAAPPIPAAPPAPPAEPEVDVDVTQLVKSSDEATQAATDASQKSSALLAKFGELEQRVSNMDVLTQKIDTLEKEIIKRNPTPIEKLEMRSLDSFPFNIKISDYWKDVAGYDPRGGEEENKEYVLTKDDVDSGFSDGTIKNSFNEPNDYEEEDIN